MVFILAQREASKGSMASFLSLGLHYVNYRASSRAEITPPVLLLVTPIDLSTHVVTHFGSRPFTSFVQSFDTWYSDKRLADRFTGFRVNTSHQGQSILPIPHTGILDSLRNRSRDQFVAAGRVFRRDPREDVIRWRRLHGSQFKYGQTNRLYGGNTQFIDDRQAAAIVRRKKSAGLGMKNSWTTG